jgi:WD40 repeat protein
LNTGDQLKNFKSKTSIIHVVQGPGEKNILITSEDSAAHLLNNSGQQIVSFKHENAVSTAVVMPGFKSLLTASLDKTARLWDVTGKQTGPVMNHKNYVNSAMSNANGKWIVTAGWDSAVHLWITATLKEFGSSKKQNDIINSAVFSPDSRWILTASYDSTAQLWEIEGDLDLPANLFKLQSKAITGVLYDYETNTAQPLKTDQWNLLKEQYNSQASDHYKVCKYPRYNLWKRFNYDEAKK